MGTSEQTKMWYGLLVVLVSWGLCSADFCCMVPDFGNDNIAPELIACRQACRAFVQYKSLQSCAMNDTCGYVDVDYVEGIALATARLAESTVCSVDNRVCYPGVDCLGGECQAPPHQLSIPCELSLRKALCAYHFPNCISDSILMSNEVCMETCDEVLVYCNFSLDEITKVPRCATRNFGCTSGGGHLIPSEAFVSLVAIVVALVLKGNG